MNKLIQQYEAISNELINKGIRIDYRHKCVQFKSNTRFELNGWMLHCKTADIVSTWGNVALEDVQRSQEWLKLENQLRLLKK